MEIRPFARGDLEEVVELSLLSCETVFSSIRQTIGPALFGEFYGKDWKQAQREAVVKVCRSEEHEVAVAVRHGRVVGFAALRMHTGDRSGEIYMIAVSPGHQRRGVGSALTAWALDRFAENGMSVAMVETGADPGHAPARGLYEHAGFTVWPAARYFKKLYDVTPGCRISICYAIETRHGLTTTPGAIRTPGIDRQIRRSHKQ